MDAQVFGTNAQIDPRQVELAARVAQLAPADGMNETRLPSVTLMRASSPTQQKLPSLYEPSLCIVVQGRKQAILRRETYIYDPLNYLVVSVTLPVGGQIIEATPRRPYLSMRIAIDTAMIAELLSQVPPRKAPDTSARGLFVARMSEPMTDAALRLMRLFDSPADLAVLGPLALRELHYRALTGELGYRLQELCSSGGNVQRIARAIAMIKSRYMEPLRIEALAEAVHMSTSSLHHHFKAVTAMSPLQYQKHLRLHEARRLLLSDGLDASAVAHRVGYESASQFSREYRRLFGVPPSRTTRSSAVVPAA